MVASAFVLLLAVGVPIAFVLAISALIYIVSSDNSVLLASYPQKLFGGLENYGLLALPLFILVGECMNEGGIARRLMAMASALIGSVKGGLAYVNLLSNMLMAAILGSTVAQITVMSKVAVPEMVRMGYKKDTAVTITAIGGLLAPIIPPSMLFVIFGVTAQVSIGDLFLAGIVPGILLFTGFLLLLAWMARKHDFPHTEKMTTITRLACIRDGLPAALIPALIVGSILSGLATPTESAALACLGAIVVGKYIYKELAFRSLWPALQRSAQGSAVVLILIAGAQLLSWVMTYENLPQLFADFLQATTDSPMVFLALVALAMLLIGMVIDPIPALILIVPVLLPIATEFGVDAIHFGVVVCLCLVLGLLTPPVGAALFTASALSGVKAERIALLSLPFLLVMIAVLILLIVFPALSTWLQ